MEVFKFESSFEYKLIYVFRINDEDHYGYLKIGDATIKTSKPFNELIPSSKELNKAAKKRIDEYTSTAGIRYDLLYTEVAVYKNNDKESDKYGLTLAFRDHDVHNVLKRSGIQKKYFETNKKQNEWFKCDLETAKNAILAVKNNRKSLNAKEVSTNNNPIIFRPEQEEAILKTLKVFKKNNGMLWNAKMRFGKTLTALEVVKRSNFQKTIIVTHRPVVENGWFEDFEKIFYDRKDFIFGSKNKGENIENLIKGDNKFVYFASLQDLRGSEKVGGNFNKNDDIFKIDRDFVVVDEAHEGTKTQLGSNVLQAIIKPNNEYVTKTLELSGTPFNLMDDYEDENIYTWDYIMEQEAKNNWIKHNFGDSNPYEELPKLNIFTYHLEKIFQGFSEIEDKAFNFKEFFRVWSGDINIDRKEIPNNQKIGDFVHEKDVKAFLDLLSKESEDTNYPYSTKEYRNYFNHTLWVVPGVKEAKALASLLRNHPVFSLFTTVNVAGEGDEETDSNDAYNEVKNAITKNPEETYTITISCGRLTTGVTIPEWTAVFYLAGSYSTKATQYLQTIFRVQSPANINGKIKENCYVFDFAPDRTLSMVAQSVQLSQKGMGSKNERARLGEFLNYCSIISFSDSSMEKYNVDHLLQELKKAYVEKVVSSGFENDKLYNDELLKLDGIEIEEFKKLQGIIGQTKAIEKTKSIEINNQGFNEEEHEKIANKSKKELTEEEIKRLQELKEKRKIRDNAISILRGISIRIPLLVYGADVPITKDITIEEFPNLVDDNSWIEFMPKGITKEIFLKFSKYYDKDIFIASTYRIRALARAADEYEPTSRIKKIAAIFKTFRNPDKETVLTPWRVVNMHMSNTIGGYDFFDEEHKEEMDEPRLIKQDDITDKIFTDDGKVLEINSKTGLYPLYLTYTFYRYKLKVDGLNLEDKLNLWDQVIKDNIYVICKTKMAKQITKRTLLGYREGDINAHAFDDLINQFKSKQDAVINKITSCNFWNKEGNKMKFNAVVGNPPYQEVIQNRSEQPPVYNYFYDVSMTLCNLVTLITPARFLFNAGMTPEIWNTKMLNNEHFKVVDIFMNSTDIFDNVDIKGGVVIGLYNHDINYGAIKKYFSNDILKGIYLKTAPTFENSLASILHSSTSCLYTKELDIDFPDLRKQFTRSPKQYVASADLARYPSIFKESKENENDIGIIGRVNNERTVRRINRKYIQKIGNLDKFKVLIPSSNGSGAFGERISTPMIGQPMIGHNQSFISLGDFDTEKEANNLLKYVKTKFLRTLIGLSKVTQSSSGKDVWSNIPLLNFKENNPINFDVSVDELDKQLFALYKFSNDEILFINEKVQKMD